MTTNAVLFGIEGAVAHVQADPSPIDCIHIFSVGDAAKVVGVSVTSIKRISAELRMNVLHTVGGVKLFTADQVEQLKAECQRREQEALK